MLPLRRPRKCGRPESVVRDHVAGGSDGATDRVASRRALDVHSVPAIAQGSGPGGVRADQVTGHDIVRGIAHTDSNGVLFVTRDHVARAGRGAADCVIGRSQGNVHAVPVGNRDGTRDVRADIIALYHVILHARSVELDPHAPGRRDEFLAPVAVPPTVLLVPPIRMPTALAIASVPAAFVPTRLPSIRIPEPVARMLYFALPRYHIARSGSRDRGHTADCVIRADHRHVVKIRQSESAGDVGAEIVTLDQFAAAGVLDAVDVLPEITLRSAATEPPIVVFEAST